MSTKFLEQVSEEKPTGQAVVKVCFIDAATGKPVEVASGSAFSGSYDDLTDKPTIPEAYTLAAASADALGGVKQAAAVADVATDADAPTVAAAFNSLLAGLRSAGVLSV